MGQRATVILTDGATTPVNRSFFPTLNAEGILQWRDRTQPVFVGQNRLSVSQRIANKQSKATKVAWKLETPVLEQTSTSTTTGVPPPPTVAYIPLATVEFVLPDRCSLQERKDLLAMLRDLLGEAIVTTQVQDLDLIY